MAMMVQIVELVNYLDLASMGTSVTYFPLPAIVPAKTPVKNQTQHPVIDMVKMMQFQEYDFLKTVKILLHQL